ncbi:MAG: VCBS repeat-containing protein, partial [Acidobacteriota bacterium]
MPHTSLLVRCLSGSLLLASVVLADGGVTFTDIANDPASGLSYERARSATAEVMDALRQQSLVEPLPPMALASMPYNTNGQPGIAVFDYDGDGDLDIYVTNGPGADNSLFQSQLEQTGALSFVDVGAAAGVAATAQDGMGVCYGDTDNDGDDDLLVLGRDEPNRFFVNNGDGTFSEITDSALAGGETSSPSCTFGDIDNDGLLDLLIGNAYDHGDLLACMVEPYALTEHNQLFHNQGGHVFVDISDTSGIRDLTGYNPPADGEAGITWAVSMVDVDLDGDLDLIFGDDQCAMLETYYGGAVDRGFLHFMINDGSGQFTDLPMLDGPFPSSSWMGLGFGDLDCDGTIDVFGSNFGDYMDIATNTPYTF